MSENLQNIVSILRKCKHKFNRSVLVISIRPTTNMGSYLFQEIIVLPQNIKYQYYSQ